MGLSACEHFCRWGEKGMGSGGSMVASAVHTWSCLTSAMLRGYFSHFSKTGQKFRNSQDLPKAPQLVNHGAGVDARSDPALLPSTTALSVRASRPLEQVVLSRQGCVPGVMRSQAGVGAQGLSAPQVPTAPVPTALSAEARGVPGVLHPRRGQEVSMLPEAH